MGMAVDAAGTPAEPTDNGRPRARHDQTYKAFYELVGTLRDLLCGYLPEHIEGAEEWFNFFDFERAELISTEHTTTDLASRYIDMLWKLPIVKGSLAGTDLYVVVMLEFQSSVDRYMALRVQSAATRIYERLWKDPQTRTGWLVPILPIVVYNGPTRWKAPTRMRDLLRPGTVPNAEERPWEPGFTGDSYVVIDVGSYAGRKLPANNIVSLMIRRETMQVYNEAGTVLDESLQQLEAPELVGLRQQFVKWFRLLMLRHGVDCKELEDEKEVERLAKEGKIRSFLDARVQEAKSKLKAEGLEQGLEQERELLQGLAKRRFGAETADRLAACLAQVREHDRLMAIGGWLLDCTSGTELLDRVEGRV